MKKIMSAFFLCFLAITTFSQSYNCTFLNLILKGIDQHKNEYAAYSTSLNYKRKALDKLDDAKDIELSDQIIDSLKKCCNYTVFFDDSLFHMGDTIFCIDTFRFLDNSCLGGKKAVTIVNQYIDLSLISGQYDIIMLKSIRVYKNKFIIVLQHIKSNREVEFYFDVIGTFLPQLTKIADRHPLDEWYHPLDQWHHR